MNVDITTILISVIGGLLPSLAWLFFWLREDKLHPEPRGRLIACFIAGMVGVVIAYPLEKIAFGAYGLVFTTLLIWAIVEEIIKYAAAEVAGLSSKDFDEPVDGLIYMITAALGFSALENTLYIFGHLTDGVSFIQSLAGGNMRFIGASLLHVVSSSAIGYATAKVFYMKLKSKIFWRIVGLTVAITLHTLFNLFIIQGNNRITFAVFGTVWTIVIVLLVLFERVKKFSR
jgi:RsiW-degrading membrane proteinase PrsW (M82 family)